MTKLTLLAAPALVLGLAFAGAASAQDNKMTTGDHMSTGSMSAGSMSHMTKEEMAKMTPAQKKAMMEKEAMMKKDAMAKGEAPK